MKETIREVDILVLSDIHLGTYGCHASELLHYLKSVSPKKVILNGDIIDIWQFSKRYWPGSHMLIIRHLLGWIANGIQVYYITGNHDEMLRKFSGCHMGSLHIVNKLVIEQENQTLWFFHGDVFDVTMQHAKWLTRLGAVGYDTLILINRGMNYVLTKMGKEKLSLSKKIKDSVKQAVSFINSFEETVAEIAINNGYHAVICGHIHHPVIKKIYQNEHHVLYMNSGDWVENLSALEYIDGHWTLYTYHNDVNISKLKNESGKHEQLSTKTIYNELVDEFARMKNQN